MEAKWLNGSISVAEAQEYADWYNEGQANPVEIPATTHQSKLQHRNALLQKINEKRFSKVISLRSRLLKISAVAAALLIMLFAGWKYLLPSHKAALQTTAVSNHSFKTDVRPGTTKARLTLSNGQTIVLDSAANGVLAKQGSININNNNGQVSYIGVGETTKMVYNTLQTGKGEQYPITLSDGTHVWLNAASSLHFPVAFIGNERRVEISGEAYFEVAKNAAKPFIVTAGNNTVKVLGTHFNINAYYTNNDIKTTLLEGSININDAAILKPGQQSVVSNSGNLQLVNDADIEQAVAWKNGMFRFHNTDIKAVMRDIENWYDIKVVYEGAAPTDHFSGSISRTATLSEVLLILQYSKVHFKLEERKLSVMP